jgi:hypothetical protein
VDTHRRPHTHTHVTAHVPEGIDGEWAHVALEEGPHVVARQLKVRLRERELWFGFAKSDELQNSSERHRKVLDGRMAYGPSALNPSTRKVRPWPLVFCGQMTSSAPIGSVALVSI